MFISNLKARRCFTLVTPETILYRWKRAIKDYWTYDKPKTRNKGRPPITKAMKLLIKNLKIDNYLWGCKRIQDELEKISINISRETIRKVIQDYRKSGEIKTKLLLEQISKISLGVPLRLCRLQTRAVSEAYDQGLFYS